MALAKVWNDNSREYVEMFRETEIKIPAKGFVEMDYHEAHLFMGQYIPVKKAGDGTFLNPKMLRLETNHQSVQVEKVTPKCHLCKEEFQTEKELIFHSELKHKAQMIEPEAKEKSKK